MSRRRDRAVDELIGLCRGIIADGAVVTPEATYLRNWLAGQIEHLGEYPFNLIAERICDALGDDHIDEDEEKDLLELCLQITSNPQVVDAIVSASSASTSLPLTPSPPLLSFEGINYVLTGVFEYGSRKEVARAIVGRGGVVNNAVLKNSHVLVIGNIGSGAWAHSTHGRKIEDACRRGGMLIVDEAHWASCL